VIKDLSFKAIDKGIRNVIKNTGIQGRFEIISKDPFIIFDCAHNLDGIDVFLNEYQHLKFPPERSKLIIGVMRDKNYIVMLKKLSKCFDTIYAAPINYERALTPIEIVDAGSKLGIHIKITEDPVLLVKKFKLAKKEECLVALGSIFLLGELKKNGL
jgi:dihydrofolate synthase/folylpolyglutamate synthase